MGCENLRMHGSQLLLWAASQFFSKMLTYKRAYSGVKLSLCARAPDRNYDISCFPIGPKANGDSGLYALSKALIAFRFLHADRANRGAGIAMRTRLQQCFDTELSGCGSPPPRSFTRFRLTNYYFHHAHTGISL